MIDSPRQPPAPTSPYMPDMGPEDYAPPEWRLVQPTSQSHIQDKIPLGHYYCEETGEDAERLDIAILKVQRNRTYWISADLNFPACSSDDRIMPRPGGMYQGPCVTCEANSKGCYPGYNLLCVRLDQQGKPEPSEMFLLRVNGTSVFPFRKLWSRIHLNHQDNPWSIMVTLTSQMKSNERGTYWVMQPDINQEFTFAAELPILKALADGLAGQEPAGQGVELAALPDPEYGPGKTTVVDARPTIVVGARPKPTPAPTTAPHNVRASPPLVTGQEAQTVVALAERLGVPPETITPFIQNTFGKNWLHELHQGELGMLTKWLEQEFGQTVERETNRLKNLNLPF